MAKKSHLEEEFARQLTEAGIAFEREVKGIVPGRRFRFDFVIRCACESVRLIVEVDGGTWSGGRHTSGVGFRNDCIKLNGAVEQGYVVLRYTSDLVKSGEGSAQVRRYLAATCPQTLSEPV